MVDVRGDVLRPQHGTTPAAVNSVNSNINSHKTLQKEDKRYDRFI